MSRAEYIPAEEQKRLFSNVLSSTNGIRNHAILRLLYGYPLRGLEAIRLKTHDLVTDEGKVKVLPETNQLRAAVSFSGVERRFPLTSEKIISALQQWVDYRLANSWGVRGQFIDMESPFFLKNKTEGFSEKTPEGFSRLIKDLHRLNGIEGNIETPLRTWTLIQHENCIALKTIWSLRGDKSIETVRRAIKGHPIKYSQLVENIA